MGCQHVGLSECICNVCAPAPSTRYDLFFMSAIYRVNLIRIGGELFVVVPKSKSEKKKMEKHFNSAFKVVSDPDNHLANKFKITVHKHESKLHSLLHSASTPIAAASKRHSMSFFPISSGQEAYHFAHPGIISFFAIRFFPLPFHFFSSSYSLVLFSSI
jgi:hypothetical protein